MKQVLIPVRQTTAALLALSLISASAPAWAVPEKITPQRVVDQALGKGRSAKSAELQAQRSYLQLEEARGLFDLKFLLAPGYELNEGQSLSGMGNPQDKTWSLAAQLDKKFQSGTELGLKYEANRQSSILAPSVVRTSNIALEAVTLSLRQPLFRNWFGYADRLALEIGETGVATAAETRQESLETVVLDAMTLFWNAYTAEQQLKENMAAREKYEQLVANVRRKASFNLSTPGELPRLLAEAELADQRVKSSSAAYLNAVDSLLTAMQIQTKEPIEIVAPQELPPVPQLAQKNLDELRVIRVAAANLQNAERKRDQVISQTRPRLDLVARARSTGVEEDAGAAYAEMTSGTKPTYFVGFEFETPIDSNIIRGRRADAVVAASQAEVELKVQQDKAKDQLAALERTVAANFAVAKSMIEAVQYRERTVREMEIAWRQGRQPLVELIRSYNDLFNTQLERAKAVGQYHISLNQLAAARDELITTIQK